MTLSKTLGLRLGTIVVIGLLGVGCNPDPGPTPSPTPTSSPTPTENAAERQERLDFEAAEKSYRTFRAEFDRVRKAGGAKKATPVMRATAAGDYLDTFEEIVQAYHGLGDRLIGNERIAYVKQGAYSPKSLLIDVCEDGRSTRIIDKNGKQVGKGEIRSSTIEVRKIDGVWKLWTGEGEKVATCP